MGRLLKALQKIEAALPAPVPATARKAAPEFALRSIVAAPETPAPVAVIEARTATTPDQPATEMIEVAMLPPVGESPVVPACEPVSPELPVVEIAAETAAPVVAETAAPVAVETVALPVIEEIVAAAPPRPSAPAPVVVELSPTLIEAPVRASEFVRLSDYMALRDEPDAIAAELYATTELAPLPAEEIAVTPVIEANATAVLTEPIPLPRDVEDVPAATWGWDVANWPALTAEEQAAVRELDLAITTGDLSGGVTCDDPLTTLQNLLAAEIAPPVVAPAPVLPSAVDAAPVPTMSPEPTAMREAATSLPPAPAQPVAPLFVEPTLPGLPDLEDLTTLTALADDSDKTNSFPTIAIGGDPDEEIDEPALAARFRVTEVAPQGLEFRPQDIVIPEEEGLAILGGQVSFWTPSLDLDDARPNTPRTTTLEGLAEDIIRQQPALAGRVLLLAPTTHRVKIADFAADLCLALGPHVQTPIEYVNTATFPKTGSPEEFLREKCAVADLILVVAMTVDALTLARWSPHCDAVYLIGNQDDQPEKAVERLIARWPYVEDRLYGCVLQA